MASLSDDDDDGGNSEYVCFCGTCDNVFLVSSNDNKRQDKILNILSELNKLLVKITSNKKCIDKKEFKMLKDYVDVLESLIEEDNRHIRGQSTNKNELDRLACKLKNIFHNLKTKNTVVTEKFNQSYTLLNEVSENSNDNDETLFVGRCNDKKAILKNRKYRVDGDKIVLNNNNNLKSDVVPKKKYATLCKDVCFDLQKDKNLKFPKNFEKENSQTHKINIENYKKYQDFIKRVSVSQDTLKCIPGIGNVYSERLVKHIGSVNELIDVAVSMDKYDFKALLKCYANVNSYYSELIYSSLLAHRKKYGGQKGFPSYRKRIDFNKK